MRKIIRDFLQIESASGLVLFAATLLALLWANSSFSHNYDIVTNSSRFFVNEVLMALFFLLVGLELKRGWVDGLFSSVSDIALPLIAAIGGMLIPAVVYFLCNIHHPEALVGWATPVATDIAFALVVLTICGGSRLPSALRLFLLSIAIFDDIGAVFIIVIFYSATLHIAYLVAAAGVIAALLLLNKYRIYQVCWYLLGGLLLWGFFLKAGIHPTIAGVVTALLIPKGRELEHKLHPWVAFVIMPLFALMNAGLPLRDVDMGMLFDSVTIGIILGLFIGKQIGVMGSVWLSVKVFRLAKLPYKATWLQVYGVALLCGIGFTMSLFLGTLSFQGQSDFINEVRLGVMAGSLLSGLAGALVLTLAAT